MLEVGRRWYFNLGGKKREACEPDEVAGPGTGTGTSIDSTTLPVPGTLL